MPVDRPAVGRFVRRCLAERDADPDRELGDSHTAGDIGRRPLQPDRALDGVADAAEHGHDAVTEVLHDRAVRRDRRRTMRCAQGRPDLLAAALAETNEERRRVDDVREDDCHDPSLAHGGHPTEPRRGVLGAAGVRERAAAVRP